MITANLTVTDRITGRRYQLVKVFVVTGGAYLEGGTGRRYNLIKRYI